MKKLSPFQKFCARFSRKFPGAVSIMSVAAGFAVAAAAISHVIKNPYNHAALYAAVAGVLFWGLVIIIALFLSPKFVGGWKDRLPEEAIKYADEVAEKFPQVTEALEDWKKVALKQDDGTSLLNWAYYFEQLMGAEKLREQALERLEEVKRELERLRQNV